MTTSCSRYTLKVISRFMDKELPESDIRAVKAHLEQCSICREKVKNLAEMEDAIRIHITGLTDKAPPLHLDIRTIQQERGGPSVKHHPIFRFLLHRPGLKMASAAALVLLTLVSVFQFSLSRPPDRIFSSGGTASAIVKSVDTNFPSVMIFETENKNHTIIWFSET